MTLAIVDYGSGNLRSAAKACERAAADLGLPIQVTVTADPEVVRRADRVLLPGVGAFADCARGLMSLPGMYEVLEERVIRQGVPFLGICVGMQLMARLGLEHGEHPGLGWIDGVVEAIRPSDPALKVPHMGWNDLVLAGTHPILAEVQSGAHFYFVHSYRFRPAEAERVLAEVDYDGPLAAVIGRDNLVGTQFHPEKSQANGQALLRAFLRWRP